MSNQNTAKPIIIAHRGASAYLPEHSLAAKALAHAMGADFLEQDVVLSADGVPLVLHDIYLDSTTDVRQQFPERVRPDGRFYAIDFSLAEIRQLRLHERSSLDPQSGEVAVYPNRYPLQPTPFQVPTLAEECDLIAGLNHSRNLNTGLYVELKAPRWHQREGCDIAKAVMQVLDQKALADKPDQVFLQCFDDATLRRLRQEFNTPLPLIQLIADNAWGEDSAVDYDYLRTPRGLSEVASYANGIGPWIEQIYLGRDNRGAAMLSDLVSLAHDRDLQVHPYTFRTDQLPAGIEDGEQLLDILFQQAGIDGLFSDFPDVLHRYLTTNGQR